MKNIIFFDSDDFLEKFSAENPIKGTAVSFFKSGFNKTSDSKLKGISDAEIISVFTHSGILSNKKLDLFPKLKLITTRSTGFNHIDLDYCKARNIAVCNVPKYGATTVAEFTFGLILCLTRHIIAANYGMTHNQSQAFSYLGMDLNGKVLGVVGTGSIGQHVIKIAEGFGMQIVAYDRYHNSGLKKYYVKSLPELYAKADIISLHIPSTPENEHIINEEAFNQMKDGVIIVNTARGNLIDSSALYTSILKKKVAAVGLDVLENEDFLLRDETNISFEGKEFFLESALNLKLMQFKNVLVTPHIAFNSLDAIYRIMETTFENIKGFLNGNIQNNVVQ